MNRKGLNAMPALLKFLVPLAIFFQQVIQMHSHVSARLEIKFGSIIWLGFNNQWAIQWMNQVANRFTNQPNDWDRMHCFLATFHQKEYCFECQWWMMRSNHARLIQNILNHIKWRFKFPSFLSILRVPDWLIVGFILIGRQLLYCSTHSNLFSLLASKEVSYLPMFSSLHSMVRLQVPEWHVGFALLR